jgi:hypothetical protein
MCNLASTLYTDESFAFQVPLINGQPWYVVAVTPPHQRPADGGDPPQPELPVTKELLEELGKEIMGLYDKKRIPKAGTRGLCHLLMFCEICKEVSQ